MLSVALFYSMTSTRADTEKLDPLYAKVLESTRHDDIACAYTTTYSSEDSGVRVEHYSPVTKWRLVSVDDADPSESELDEYTKDEDERVRRRNDPSDLEFLESSVADILHINQDNAQTIEFEFKPDLGDEFPEDMQKKLSGHLTVTKDGLRPLKYVISLNDPASPMPSVKIRTFEQEVAFVEDQTTGATLVKSMSFNVRGRAFLVKRIAQEESVVFSDFDCQMVEPQSPDS